jgi:23S rRNA (uracil1939-C5)-methyltransferase
MPEITQTTGPLEITALGAQGDGLGGGLAVPFTLPGDVIENGAITHPSPHRVRPPCPHFGTCGGCALQHASDAFVRDWKRDLVARALAAHGLRDTIDAIHSSTPASRRRAVLSGRRTKKTVQLGYFAKRSETLVPINDCPLLLPQITAALDALRAIVRLAATRTSVVKLTVTQCDAGLDLAVENARTFGIQNTSQLTEITNDFARIAWNGDVILRNRPAAQTFGTAQVEPPPGAFLQATRAGEATLVAAVLKGTHDARRIIDLFAGCGTFSLPLARSAQVLASEYDAAMLKALDTGWRKATGLRDVKTEARDLFRRPYLAAELNKFDAIVLDPPRAGAAAQVAEIAQSTVPRIVYVSCNPVSYARDVKSLVEAGYSQDWTMVVDQFKWSPHTEVVGGLTRA